MVTQCIGISFVNINIVDVLCIGGLFIAGIVLMGFGSGQIRLSVGKYQYIERREGFRFLLRIRLGVVAVLLLIGNRFTIVYP